jgi:hypothetical protein
MAKADTSKNNTKLTSTQNIPPPRRGEGIDFLMIPVLCMFR